jgi:hypothetical protein
MNDPSNGAGQADELVASLLRLREGATTSGSSSAFLDCLEIDARGLRVVDEEGLRQNIGGLAEVSALGSPEITLAAHRLIWEICRKDGVIPASIEELYRAIGAGKTDRRLTVPAFNMRAVSFHSARGVFQAMREKKAGAVIFELSRGEIGFTDQRPHEYATSILCAAIAEGHRGPVFIQGDHFQISASRYAVDPAKEIAAIEVLVTEAITAGFFNIDIDVSTLVDLSHAAIPDQQQVNCELTAHFLKQIRAEQPAGRIISVGGEIGEVGEHNSSAEEVHAYLGGVTALLSPGTIGLSKLSIQSGTVHGGKMLGDGSFGDMPIDFPLIDQLSGICREPFGLGGCVQHGASMLSMEKIARLPQAGCVEVHLAAAFLNAVYDNLPPELVREADEWAKATVPGEWKTEWSEAQFLHHARRYPVGPFKKQWWRARECHAAIREAVRDLAASYMTALGVGDTKDLVAEHCSTGPVDWIAPGDGTGQGTNLERGIRDLAS